MVRSIAQAEHDDRPHVGPERSRIGAPVRLLCHPIHVAMALLSEKNTEALASVTNAVGCRNAHGFEPGGTGSVDEQDLEIAGHVAAVAARAGFTLERRQVRTSVGE